MKEKEQFVQRLPPWRKQIITVIQVAAYAVLVVIVIMIYLNISERMTALKLDLQILQTERSEYSQKIADLTTDEGILTAFKTMQKRAAALGYSEINYYDQDTYEYVLINGYTGTGINTEEIASAPITGTEIMLRPEYSQSLQQWLAERIAVGKQSYEADN